MSGRSRGEPDRRGGRELPPEPPPRGELAPRLVWGLVAGGVVLGAIWAGLPAIAPLYLVVTYLALREYRALLAARDIPIRYRTLLAASLLTLPAALPATLPWIVEPAVGVGWREVVFGGLGLALIALELGTPNVRSVQVIAFSLFGYLYVPFTLSHMLTLRYTPDGEQGAWLLLIAVIGPVAADVGGYAVGRLAGRRPLAPAVSPNKTLEGALGGVALALALTAGLVLFAGDRVALPFALPGALLLAAAGALAGLTGDLFESLLKRWSGVKDTGTVLPGHGGMLDRADSCLLGLPVVYYVAVLFVVR